MPTWQAVPAELQRLQKYKDLLLDNTEKVLLSVHPVRDYLVVSAFCHGPNVFESSCRIVQLCIIIMVDFFFWILYLFRPLLIICSMIGHAPLTRSFPLPS
jgi:hypothetical protein